MMRKPFPALLLLVASSFVACSDTASDKDASGTNTTAEQLHREDSTLWDRSMLADDLTFKGLLDSLEFPMATGVWPVARYDTPGNGSMLVEFTVHGQRVVGRALHVGRGPHNESIFPDSTRRDEVVAMILVRTDTPDEEHRSIAISRNHPHYLAEGRFTSEAGNVDWLTMQLADRQAYAVVNMRLFDLGKGRLLLVDPQRDGSLRFLQRSIPLTAQADVEGLVAGLASDPEVGTFFR